MSVATVVEKPSIISSLSEASRRKRRLSVQFQDTTDDDMVEVTTKYPKGFFYTRAETDRFRREYREERLGTSTSPVQRAFDAASSNIIMILFLLIGFISATIACLPLLLLLKAASYVVCGSSYHDGALEACHDGALEEGIEGSSFVERSLVSLIGSFASDETAKYKEQAVTPLI